MKLEEDEERNLKDLLVMIATNNVDFNKLNRGYASAELDTIMPFILNANRVKFSKEKIELPYYVFRDTENHYKIFGVPKPEYDTVALFKFDNIAEGTSLNFFGMFDDNFKKHPNFIGVITREVLEDYRDIALSLVLKEMKK